MALLLRKNDATIELFEMANSFSIFPMNGYFFGKRTAKNIYERTQIIQVLRHCTPMCCQNLKWSLLEDTIILLLLKISLHQMLQCPFLY